MTALTSPKCLHCRLTSAHLEATRNLWRAVADARARLHSEGNML